MNTRDYAGSVRRGPDHQIEAANLPNARRSLSGVRRAIREQLAAQLYE